MNVNKNIEHRNSINPGDSLCLLGGECNPPTLDYFYAIDSIISCSKFNGIWICPFVGNNISENEISWIKSLSQVTCSEYNSYSGRQIGCCTVGIDKNMHSLEEIKKWCMLKFPFLNIYTAMFLSDLGKYNFIPDYVLCFFGQNIIPQGVVPIFINKHIQSPCNIKEMISEGKDESIYFPEFTWKLILKEKIYRNNTNIRRKHDKNR